MDDFMFRFLISNLLLCGIIGVLLLMKRILKNSLSSRMQYNLWFLLLGLLAVPLCHFVLSNYQNCSYGLKIKILFLLSKQTQH